MLCPNRSVVHASLSKAALSLLWGAVRAVAALLQESNAAQRTMRRPVLREFELSPFLGRPALPSSALGVGRYDYAA